MFTHSAVPEPTVSAPPDFAYRMEADFTEIVPIGAVPEGLRMDAHYNGTVIEGPLAGLIRGIDYLLIRSDGVIVLDVRETITTAAGHHIAIRGQGYGLAGAPPPAAGAQQSSPVGSPDVPSPILGVAFCQTTAPEMLWLNRTILAFTGTANLGTGKLQVVARVLTPSMLLVPHL